MESALVQVVDDNERNVKICREILEIADFRVITAENGEIGLEMAKSLAPDVILLDIMMPVMNGIEMLHRLRKDALIQHIPVLMLTARSTTEDVVQALNSGANDYLTKPFSEEELEARVRTLARMKKAEDGIREQNEILEHKVQERTAALDATRLEIVRRLGMAAEYRDNETGEHIIRMSKMCMKLGELYGLDKERQELLLNASPMHDVGKISIPDAVLRYLTDKKDLGVHTELFSDGVMDLVEKGVLTGARKTLHPGKIIAGFILGTHKLYDWVDNNPMIELHPTEYVNDPFIIAQNERMVAINSAIEVDLTGQVCADSIGPKLYSGVGGQLDFIYGASRAKDGVPIIALPSLAVTRSGKRFSRITAMLKQGAGVVTTRNHVHYVVTEYGVANLYGKSIRQRALELINIAHPDFRDELRHQAKKLNYI